MGLQNIHTLQTFSILRVMAVNEWFEATIVKIGNVCQISEFIVEMHQ